MSQLQVFIDYFRQIAAEHRKIKSFHFGLIEAYLGNLSEWEYPTLFIDYPDVNVSDNRDGDYISYYQTGISILVNVSKNATYAESESAMYLADEILRDVLSRILRDQHELDVGLPGLSLIPGASIQPISSSLVDNLHGFRCEISVDIAEAFTYNSDNWT